MSAIFSSINGQQGAIKLLTAALTSGRIPNAYLFTGVSGVGKRTTALALARALIADEERHNPDLTIIEPTYCQQDDLIPLSVAREQQLSFNNQVAQIRIEQIRELTRFLAQAPLKSQRLVAIILNVESLTPNAAQALLKSLEEPGQALLILTTDNIESVPPTIISRAHIIPFCPLSTSKLQSVLSGLGIKVDPVVLNLAGGSVSKAIAYQQLLDELPSELASPFCSTFSETFSKSQLICELETINQLLLADYWQHKAWENREEKLVQYLELVKSQLSKANALLAWQCCLNRVRRN
ncbi:DNA polymerase III subunit delta' [Gloeothece verrucosa]|uniref:DNA polymerase III subunit delta n=1 Tax=Gloeothece verrucosa (strain PCC 7822) TaxID=497965 RepID=E0UMC7_GLOV7|nr:DNA polymerase III subunit delta' [Gloeothece verrucosa]ADN18107.1 DNA polymerase III subunit delta' [Gloeothece verrucosa PCC 7822]